MTTDTIECAKRIGWLPSRYGGNAAAAAAAADDDTSDFQASGHVRSNDKIRFIDKTF